MTFIENTLNVIETGYAVVTCKSFTKDWENCAPVLFAFDILCLTNLFEDDRWEVCGHFKHGIFKLSIAQNIPAGNWKHSVPSPSVVLKQRNKDELQKSCHGFKRKENHCLMQLILLLLSKYCILVSVNKKGLKTFTRGTGWTNSIIHSLGLKKFKHIPWLVGTPCEWVWFNFVMNYKIRWTPSFTQLRNLSVGWRTMGWMKHQNVELFCSESFKVYSPVDLSSGWPWLNVTSRWYISKHILVLRQWS